MSKLSELRNKLSKYSTSKLDDVILQANKYAHEYLTWDVDYINELKNTGMLACESPIERHFYLALVNTEINLGRWGKVKPIPVYHKKDINKVSRNRQKSIKYIYVFPQARIGSYRLDFLIKYGVVGLRPERLLAVECDGRAYHDNKDSFESDRKRDRELNSKNIRVLRFTGREINDNVTKCVSELEKVISSTI